MRESPLRFINGCWAFSSVCLAIWFYFFSDKVRIRPLLRNAAIVGVISGLCGGLFSVSGPPMILYFVSVIPDKEEYMGTTQCYFLLNNIYLLLMRSILHLIPGGILVPTLWGAGGLLIGSFLGGTISPLHQRQETEIRRLCGHGGLGTVDRLQWLNDKTGKRSFENFFSRFSFVRYPPAMAKTVAMDGRRCGTICFVLNKMILSGGESGNGQ